MVEVLRSDLYAPSVVAPTCNDSSPHLLGAPVHYGPDFSIGRYQERNDLHWPTCYPRRFRFSNVIVRESTPRAKRIIGLFPELLGIGGIQEAGRLTAAALDAIAFRRGWSAEFISLNDPTGPRLARAGERTIPFRGFGRRKIRFLFCRHWSRAAVFEGRARSIVLAAHPNLAVVSRWMRRVSPHLQTIVMAHGVEVWKPMTSCRRQRAQSGTVGARSEQRHSKETNRGTRSPCGEDSQTTLADESELPRLARRLATYPCPGRFPKQGRVILTVGRWAASERYKGVDELIRAVPQLVTIVPGLHLVAVGGGDDLAAS